MSALHGDRGKAWGCGLRAVYLIMHVRLHTERYTREVYAQIDNITDGDGGSRSLTQGLGAKMILDRVHQILHNSPWSFWNPPSSWPQ